MFKDYLYYKIPNRKKWLLTDDFLTTFKNELDAVFEKSGCTTTYWNTYTHLTDTHGFYEALKVACNKHNITKAIYEYACKLPWYSSDLFNDEILVLMYQKGIIEEGNPSCNEIYGELEDRLKQLEEDGEIEWYEERTEYKGYTIINKHWRYVV